MKAIADRLLSEVHTDGELQGRVSDLIEASCTLTNDVRDAAEQRFGDQLKDTYSGPVSELLEKQKALVSDEREKRLAVEMMRPRIALARAQVATVSRSERKKAQKELLDIETQYAQSLEALMPLKRQIADVVTLRKRVELEGESYGRRVAGEIIAADPDLSKRYEKLKSDLNAIRGGLHSKAAAAVTLELESAVPWTQSNNASALNGSSSSRDEESDSVVGGESDQSFGQEESELEIRAIEARGYAQRMRGRSLQAFAIAPIPVVFSSIMAVYTEGPIRFLWLVYVPILFVIGLIFSVRYRGLASAADEDRTDALNQLDLLRIGKHRPERRAQKMLQVNQLDLRRYYDQTLRQGRLVFYLGVGCLALGVIAAGVALLLIGSSEDRTVQVLTGSLGAVVAILSNFVGAIYLRMFSEITSSVGSFHTRLVGTHDLYFGTFLASKVDDEARRQELLATLAVEASRRHGASDV